MERASFQPGGGTQAVYANALHDRAPPGGPRAGARDEIITTVFSHPGDGAGPATAGYQLDHAVSRRRRVAALEALRAALSERTAGLMITNPEDTGHLQPADRPSSCELVHEAGGLCHYDQANANGILGITRARDAGFDLCQFNLHKTFASPHCSMGMPVGVSAVRPSSRRFCRGRRSSSTATATPSTTTGRVDRQGARVPRRAGDGRPRLRLGARARRRGAARGRRDRGAEQQLPREAARGRARARDRLRRGQRARRLEQIRYSWGG